MTLPSRPIARTNCRATCKPQVSVGPCYRSDRLHRRCKREVHPGLWHRPITNEHSRWLLLLQEVVCLIDEPHDGVFSSCIVRAHRHEGYGRIDDCAHGSGHCSGLYNVKRVSQSHLSARRTLEERLTPNSPAPPGSWLFIPPVMATSENISRSMSSGLQAFR